MRVDVQDGSIEWMAMDEGAGEFRRWLIKDFSLHYGSIDVIVCKLFIYLSSWLVASYSSIKCVGKQAASVGLVVHGDLLHETVRGISN